MPITTATPNILASPGFLFHAPLGSAVPAMTVVGSVFTDAWPVAWVNLGATEDGSTFSEEINVEPVEVAELYDPIRYYTTSRTGSIQFNLADWTAANVKRAMNGGTLLVTGATTTTLTKFTPPLPGAEVRAMIGWESTTSDVRIIGYQCLSASPIASSFKKAPALATLPVDFKFEVPISGTPFEIWTSGTARA